MNDFLETGISLVLIFFIFSIITYVIQELIAVNLKYRSKMMWKSLAQLMDGLEQKGLKIPPPQQGASATPNTDQLYQHAQIKTLQKNLKKMPSYIPAANFALALMDMVAQKVPAKSGNIFTDIKSGLQSFVNNNGDIYKVLDNLLQTSKNITELQNKLEDWFNNYMNRVSGWYQSHVVVSVRIIAVVIAVVFNINVIKLAKIIFHDGKIRASMVAMSEGVVDNSAPLTKYYTTTFEQENADKIAAFKNKIDSAKGDQTKIAAIEKEKDSVLSALATSYSKKNIAAIQSLTKGLEDTGLPLGWKTDSFSDEIKGKKDSNPVINFLLMIAGLLIGAGCISMGAPFWFDMLSKLVNVRRSGVKPKK